MAENEAKRAAAEAAVAEVESGMLVGLGTGSTAAFAIAALGRRVAQGLHVTAAATSLATEVAARAAGIPLVAFDDFAQRPISPSTAPTRSIRVSARSRAAAARCCARRSSLPPPRG